MELSVDASELAGALKVVVRAIGTNTANPALVGVKLEAANSRLTLTCTDLSMSIERVISAKVVEDGVMVVPGKLLNSLLGKAHDGDAMIRSDENTMHIEIDSVDSVLNIIDAASFPNPEPLSGDDVELDGAALAGATSAVAHATSADQGRGVLTGVFLEASDGELTLTATDSYRLATTAQKVGGTASLSALVPPGALAVFAKLSSGTVAIKTSESELAISAGGTTVRSRLVAGTYPDWRSLLNGIGTEMVLLPADDLLEALARIAPTASSTRAVAVTIGGGQVSLVASGEYGSTTATVPIDDTEHDFSFSVNLDYLSDALRSVGVDEVTLTHGEPSKPMLLGAPDNPTRSLLMPIRTV